MNKEIYCAEIGPEGQKSLALLERFDPTTQAFLLANGLKPGMQVLELACGVGIMSAWIAQTIGPTGTVLGIDNNEYQIKAAQKTAQQQQLNNCSFEVLSAYDIKKLNKTFDLVYCRFLLHHLLEPDKIIALVYEILKPKGIFICEEGIVSHGFAYPCSAAFNPQPENNELPDKNIGKKLYYKFHQQSFKNLVAQLVQPMLTTKEEKALLLLGHLETKKTFLAEGHTEAEWQYLYEELQKLINDDAQIVGFYQSCQVAGKK